jgi:hypothetical protein
MVVLILADIPNLIPFNANRFPMGKNVESIFLPDVPNYRHDRSKLFLAARNPEEDIVRSSECQVCHTPGI